MDDQLIEAIDFALKEPKAALGGGERNSEIKIAYLVLWALGWHPSRNVLLGFQISGIPDAKASHAADFVIRDNDDRLCAVGEAKQWYIGDKDWEEAIDQLSRYRKALPVSLAFLTSGRRWYVTDGEGRELDSFQDIKDGRTLVGRLRKHLGKENVRGNLCRPNIWHDGLSWARIPKAG